MYIYIYIYIYIYYKRNLRLLSDLNQEVLQSQSKLREMLERNEGALLPDVSVAQKAYKGFPFKRVFLL